MTLDELRVVQCLSKKRMSHAEADNIIKSMHTGGHGRRKGKKRKRDKDMMAYKCNFCEFYHIGHQKYKDGFDPALEHRRKYEREKSTR